MKTKPHTLLSNKFSTGMQDNEKMQCFIEALDISLHIKRPINDGVWFTQRD